MSFAALAIVIAHLAIYGAGREADEGSTAHVFQLLIAGQLPVVAFFLFRWVPKPLRLAWPVLAVQIAAVCAALAPVYFLHL